MSGVMTFTASRYENSKRSHEETHVYFVDPAKLRPSEKHNAGRAQSLYQKIVLDGIWTKPLSVERTNLIVMDGHHRLWVAKFMRLARVPVVLISYDDPDLKVTSWQDLSPFNSNRIIEAAMSGLLLDYKSTRHVLGSGLPAISIPLTELY